MPRHLSEPQPGVSADVGLHEPAFSLQLSPHAGDLSLHPSSVLQIVLLNKSNRCYANSSILSILWAIAATSQGVSIPLRAMHRFLQWLTRKPQQVMLTRLRIWQSLTFDWQAPHEQHDAAEFLAFLGPALISERDQGTWEARLVVDTGPSDPPAFQAVDHGKMWPLVLPTALNPALSEATRTEWTRQALVIRWRNQVVQHAAVITPPVLLLQFNRFDQDGQKVHHPIALSPTVFLPCFIGPSCNTTSVRYSLVAVQYHLGQTKLAGHYRVAYFSHGSPSHTTDDNRQTQACTSEDITVISKSAYNCFLVRS